MPTSKPPAYLIYMDRYHMSDPLFVKELAGRLAGPPAEVPKCLMVHGSGEKVERTLEAEGFFPERVDGVLQVEAPAQRRLVERAVREANQELVAALTDEVVSAVGVQGTSRNLLRFSEGGALEVGRAIWVEDLVKMHVVPVLSALAKDPSSGLAREVPTAEAARALAEALDGLEVTVVFFTQDGRPGLTDGADADGADADGADADGADADGADADGADADGADADGADMQSNVRAAALAGHATLPEPEAARRLAECGLSILVTNVTGLFAEMPRGTRVTR